MLNVGGFTLLEIIKNSLNICQHMQGTGCCYGLHHIDEKNNSSEGSPVQLEVGRMLTGLHHENR
jgi:hypothetical protein